MANSQGMKSKSTSREVIALPAIESLILLIRGQKVILDADLARLYGVATKVLNQAVKRNHDRFPVEFMFQLSAQEALASFRSRSQFVTLKTLLLNSRIVISGGPHRIPLRSTAV